LADQWIDVVNEDRRQEGAGSGGIYGWKELDDTLTLYDFDTFHFASNTEASQSWD